MKTTNNLPKAKEYFENMSDAELIAIKHEMEKSSFTEDSIIHKVIIDIFGKEDILVLQINQLLWPLLQVITDRLIAYSNIYLPLN